MRLLVPGGEEALHYAEPRLKTLFARMHLLPDRAAGITFACEVNRGRGFLCFLSLTLQYKVLYIPPVSVTEIKVYAAWGMHQLYVISGFFYRQHQRRVRKLNRRPS